MSSTFKFGKASRRQLSRVHPDLVAVCERALFLSSIDFSIIEGSRSFSRQKQLKSAGASLTLNSRHLLKVPAEQSYLGYELVPDQPYAHAIDAVPYVAGRNRWDWPLCFEVANAFRQAAKDLGVPLTWGGVWDHPLVSCAGDLEAECAAYIQRRKQLAPGKPVLTDGPHYELSWAFYPIKES